MKVLVVGSLRADPKNPGVQPDVDYVSKNKDGFQAACTALGKALALKGHAITVGVPNWPMLESGETPATYVIKGACDAAPLAHRQPEVSFYQPEESAPPNTPASKGDAFQEIENIKNEGKIKLKYKFVGSGDSNARVIPNVADVDCVMLISGREGTENIGYAAYSMEKPVFAITSFDGAAQRMFHEALLEKYNRYLDSKDVTADDIKALEVGWNDDPQKEDEKATKIVKTSEKLVKAFGRTRSQTRVVLNVTMGLLFIFLLGWVGIFLEASQSQCPKASVCSLLVNIGFYGLLFLSALIGAGLRTLVSYQADEIGRPSFLGEAVDAVISLLVAFGLSLIYLIGGITFSGAVVVVGNGAATGFATVAVSMSLIGLAAGYLIPLSALSDCLKNVVPQEKK